jgi:hypothetical protein
MAVFKDGVPQKLKLGNGKYAGIDVPIMIPATETVKLTAAYRLQRITSANPNWTSLVVRSPDADVKGVLTKLQPKLTIWPANEMKELNYALRRNLEHILSVCSIPVEKASDSEGSDKPIALTCGDFAMHRICVSATL